MPDCVCVCRSTRCSCCGLSGTIFVPMHTICLFVTARNMNIRFLDMATLSFLYRIGANLSRQLFIVCVRWRASARRKWTRGSWLGSLRIPACLVIPTKCWSGMQRFQKDFLWSAGLPLAASAFASVSVHCSHLCSLLDLRFITVSS